VSGSLDMRRPYHVRSKDKGHRSSMRLPAYLYRNWRVELVKDHDSRRCRGSRRPTTRRIRRRQRRRRCLPDLSGAVPGGLATADGLGPVAAWLGQAAHSPIKIARTAFFIGRLLGGCLTDGFGVNCNAEASVLCDGPPVASARLLWASCELSWTRTHQGRFNHGVAGLTPAMRRFRDVAYVPSLIEPAAVPAENPIHTLVDWQIG
jgi:hypothetical protein